MRVMTQNSNDDLLAMFKSVDKGIGENGVDMMFPENATMSFFWSMQRDAVAKAEHNKSIRWHPLYVHLIFKISFDCFDAIKIEYV